MKITIKASCLGKDGEHLEQGSVLPDYDDAAAEKLIRLGRAVEGEVDLDGTGAGDEAAELASKTKPQLLEIAELEEVELEKNATKPQIVEAILAKRAAAA